MASQGSERQEPEKDKGLDLSGFALNEVRTEEKAAPLIRATSSPRVIFFAAILAGVLAVGFMWSRWRQGRGHMPLDQSTDPKIRQEAMDFRESLLEEIPDLHGKLLEASFEGDTTLGVTLVPANVDQAADAVQVKKTLVRVLTELRRFLRHMKIQEPATEVAVNAYRSGVPVASAKYRADGKTIDVEFKSALGEAAPEIR
jgi:hypothetical protein